MLTYSEMFRPSMNQLVENAAAVNDALAEVLYAVAGDWIRAHERIGKRMLRAAKPSAAQPGPAPGQASPEASIFQATAGRSEPGVDDISDMGAAGDSDGEPGDAVDEVSEPVPGGETVPDAAVAIPTNPALPSDAAVNEAPGEDIEEVHDDVSDDIANEIAREAAEEEGAAPAPAK